MLSLSWMGLFALAAFWGNVTLIAMAAWTSLRLLHGRARDLAQRTASLLHGRVEQGRGEEGALARRTVEQVGRAVTLKGPRRILFVDSSDVHEVFGGALRVDGIVRDIAPSPQATLWSEPKRTRRLATDFEAAWPEASTARGVRLRALDVLRPGDEAWVLLDAAGTAELVSTMDPREEVARGRRTLWLLLAVTLLPAAAITALILIPPLFGPLSTLGGVLALGFFLAIQPIAVALQDQARMPDARRVGGVWAG